MDEGFELQDHTADLALRAWAQRPAGLVVQALAGLYAAFGEVVAADSSGEPVALRYEAGDPAVALRDLLAEALLRLETEACVLTDVDVKRFDEHVLEVAATVRPLDRDRSELHREVKAVTYHELDLTFAPEHCEFRCIVDI